MMKNVEEIEVDFRLIDSSKVRIISNQATENKIIKTGYTINDKLIYPAEVCISPDYDWLIRSYNLNENFERINQFKLRKIIAESIELENNLFLSLDKYFLEMEEKHLLSLPDYFKDYFKLLFLKSIEQKPECSFIRLAYRETINKIIEQFRKILEKVPSFDVIKTTRKEAKEQEKELVLVFSKWFEDNQNVFEDLREELDCYLNLEKVKTLFPTTLLRKFPWQIKSKSTEEELFESYKFLRRANYFIKALVSAFKKATTLTIGTEQDLEEDYVTIFMKHALPSDLFINTSCQSISQIIDYVDQLIGETNENKFKLELKDLLLAKGFLNENNYKQILKELANLNFPVDLMQRKEVIINFLKINFK